MSRGPRITPCPRNTVTAAHNHCPERVYACRKSPRNPADKQQSNHQSTFRIELALSTLILIQYCSESPPKSFFDSIDQWLPLPRRWQHVRCIPDSCRPVESPNSAALGHV